MPLCGQICLTVAGLLADELPLGTEDLGLYFGAEEGLGLRSVIDCFL